MKKIEIKKGDRYGLLTIIKEVIPTSVPSRQNLRRFSCLCYCGKKVEVYLCNLRKTGHTTSCGCERTKRIVKFLKDGGHYKKHGMYGSPEYVSWNSMKNHHSKETCPSWLDFENFLKDMGERPGGMILGRINTEKRYEKENCKWMTQVEHAPRKGKHPCWFKDRNLLKKSDRNGKSSVCMEWKKNIYKRDNWKCKINNEYCDGRLEAHHILPWIDFPELRFDINNGITLCHAHHPRKRKDVAELSPYLQKLVAEKN